MAGDHGHGGGHGGHGDGHGSTLAPKLILYAALLVFVLYLGATIPFGDVLISMGLSINNRSTGPARYAPAATIPERSNPECTGLKVLVTFGSRPVRINPSGRCAIDLYFEDRNFALLARRINEARVYGPIGRGQKLPPETEYVWSSGSPITGFYSLSAPRYRN